MFTSLTKRTIRCSFVLVVSSFLRIPTRLLQAGEKPKDPRHCYANPTSPEICLLLSLGIFFAVCPFDVDQVRLFPGGNQYERLVYDAFVITVYLSKRDRGISQLFKGAESFARRSGCGTRIEIARIVCSRHRVPFYEKRRSLLRCLGFYSVSESRSYHTSRRVEDARSSRHLCAL